MTDKAVTLLAVSPRADWGDHSTWELEDITRIEFGGPYEAALHAVAGPPPPHDVTD